jgi:nucleotide-binding universal stress UspA family protein
MYRRILVPLENSAYDAAIIEHVRKLATFCHASVVLIHVADGWAARNVHQLNLRESEEMHADREYLDKICREIAADGIPTESVLAAGDPTREIVSAAAREDCDLIAMATHGHRFLQDVVRGSVANDVRHEARVPVLLVRGERRSGPRPVPPEPSA